MLVWLPVLGYLLLVNQAMTTLDAAVECLSRHRRPTTVYVLVVVGVALLVSGVLLL